jgi:hypothetical protein
VDADVCPEVGSNTMRAFVVVTGVDVLAA